MKLEFDQEAGELFDNSLHHMIGLVGEFKADDGRQFFGRLLETDGDHGSYGAAWVNEMTTSGEDIGEPFIIVIDTFRVL